MRLPHEEAPSEMHLTPLIDVVFLLLIFFLVATRFHEEEREIDTKLPEVAEALPLAVTPQEVVVNISEKGEYVIVGEVYTEGQLRARLHARAVKNPHQRVQIRAHERVAWKYPAEVMGICEKENLEHYCAVLKERP